MRKPWAEVCGVPLRAFSRLTLARSPPARGLGSLFLDIARGLPVAGAWDDDAFARRWSGGFAVGLRQNRIRDNVTGGIGDAVVLLALGIHTCADGDRGRPAEGVNCGELEARRAVFVVADCESCGEIGRLFRFAEAV